jgi:DNA-binding transcriptional MocR family regulator
VARPGDTVAVESPTYYLLLHALASLGLKVLEIPTHPATGASLEAIDLATSRRGAIKALLLVPTHQNPVGSVMPDEHKARLVELCEQRGVALIEDDIYGDASFGQTRPLPAKAWDKRGSVLYCSSFTKTLAPGMRVGWCAPGRYIHEVALTKRATSVFTAYGPQLAIAEFLATGGYDRHLKRLRASLRDNARRVLQCVQETFPAGCRVTNPTGGFVLWVELPRKVDAVALFRRARAENIVIAPGPLFSMSTRYGNFVRISFGEPWSPDLERAIAIVGQLAGSAVMSAITTRARPPR